MWKGKSKAIISDFEDIHRIITYRHLLSQNLGVKDPLRVVALCDSDAFYAACEQVRLGLDPALPLVVQQWDSLIAVNYPARKYGITRMEKISEAKRKCPELVVVHVATYKEGEAEPSYWENPDTLTHKVSLDHYRRESMKIIQMFKDGLPTAEIEKASIDEAFIDFTRPVRDEILKRYPYLAQVPPDAPNGLDSPLPPPPPICWDNLGTVIPAHPNEEQLDGSSTTEPQEDVGASETGAVDGDDSSTTWHDVALSVAAEFMMNVRHEVYAKLGYTLSAGIARNKFLAKLTASYKKPNNQSVLRDVAIPNYLTPMPFQKIRFLGGKLGKALAQEYDVSTVGDLLTISLDEMQRKFGENSIWVYEILRGIDRSEVKEKSAVNKSMLASKNLLHPVTKPSQGHHWIRVLAAELALRLNEARENIPALWPKTIVLHVRHGYDSSRSKQAAFPFTRNVTVDVIAAAGDKLWKELVGTDSSRSTPISITSVQLSFTGIELAETGQRNIEGFLKARPPVSGDQSSAAAGSTKRKRDEREFSEPPFVQLAAEDVREDVKVSETSARVETSFVCKRCGKRVALSDVDASAEDAIARDMLAALRMEHEDFHFAQELAGQSEDVSAPRKIRPSDTPVTKRKVPKVKEGIARFFTQR
ncbi:DNA polymerase eta [Obba rivulosa]|uniref:DNA polymerase eta n=1 Tax=Obba rivulosa TaxID=1052685 RepID=A0A8E2AHX9_9APHY|nr:DNA polymerase eta [Obba rivulosa]